MSGELLRILEEQNQWYRRALLRAVHEGRNVLPDATDDQANVIEEWASAVIMDAPPVGSGPDERVMIVELLSWLDRERLPPYALVNRVRELFVVGIGESS